MNSLMDTTYKKNKELGIKIYKTTNHFPVTREDKKKSTIKFVFQ